MSSTYLEISYRQGKPVAAYLYLPRNSGDHAEQSRRSGSFVADLTADGRLIGVELTSVRQLDLSELDELLRKYHAPAVDHREFRPLIAA